MEGILNPDMKLARSHLKPAPATSAQRFGFFDFGEVKQRAEKDSSLGLASFRGGYLDMIEVDYEHGALSVGGSLFAKELLQHAQGFLPQHAWCDLAAMIQPGQIE